MNNTRTDRLSLHPVALLALALAAGGCMGAPVDGDADEVAQSAGALTLTQVTAAPRPYELPPLVLARPTLTGFSPASARVNTPIVLNGTMLNLTRSGRPALAGMPYTVSFAAGGGTRVNAPGARLVSPTQIAVTVPLGATTGRVRLSDGLGVISESPTDFVVVTPPPPPPPTRVRVVNNNQYSLVSVVVNGALVASCADPIAPGASREVNVMPGSFAVAAVIGLCVGGQAQSIPPAALEIRDTVAASATFTATANPFTLGELLTNWGANSGEWASDVFTDASGNLRQNSFRFSATAAWTGFDFGSPWGSGQAQLVSWQRHAACVTFRMSPSGAPVQTCLPFSGFVVDGLPHVRR